MTGRRGRVRGAKTAAMPPSKPNDSNEDSSGNEEDQNVKIKSESDEEEAEEKIEGGGEEEEEAAAEEDNNNVEEEEASGDNEDSEEKSETPAKKPATEPFKNVTFDCSMCFFTTDSDGNFVKHIEELHRRDMGFWCKACGSAYESSTQLIEHIRLFCDKVKHYQHTCGFQTCSFKTHDPANLIFHFRNEHKGKYLFPCGQCDQQFTILTSLVLHQQQKCSNKEMCAISASAEAPRPKPAPKQDRGPNAKDRRFRCALCTFETTQKNMFVEHHTDLHQRDLCCCKHCGKVFKNADNLAGHIDEEDCESNKYEHPCGNDDCDFKTHDPLAYRNHIRNGHTRTSLHKCKGCRKQFTIIPLLLMHIQEECSELNAGGARAEATTSNGNKPEDTVRPFTTAMNAQVHYARRAPTARRGGGTPSRRGRAAPAPAPAPTASRGGRARGTQKRVRTREEPGSSDDSDVDDPDALVTPSRTSSRVAGKKRVSYAHHSDNSDDDY